MQKNIVNIINYKKLFKSTFFLLSMLLIFNVLIQKAYAKETKDIVVSGCEAFEYVDSKTTACLLIHGLGGCPHETRALGQYLNKKGFTVSGVRYPGHGTKGKAISNYEWQDWYREAETKYLELKSKYKKVYVVGFSNGGTLGLRLAEKHDVEKLVLLSPFMSVTYKWYYILHPEIYLNTVGRLFDNIPSYLTATHINDPVERKKYVRGESFSFKCGRSALELIKLVKQDIKKVKAPVLIMHSTNDMTTEYSESRDFIYKNISSESKKLITLEKSNHIITLDYDKRTVYKEVEKFLKNE